jgi:hypothetical protein
MYIESNRMFVFGGITDRNGFNGEPLAKVNDEERMFILIPHVMSCLIFNFKMYMHVFFRIDMIVIIVTVMQIEVMPLKISQGERDK